MRSLTLAVWVCVSIAALSGAEPGSVNSVPEGIPGVSQHEPIHENVTKARTFLATGDYANAERSLRMALVAAADDPESNRTVRTALADLLREEGRSTEARQFYTDVLNAQGVTLRQKFDAWSGMGDLDGMAAQTELANGEWEQAIGIAREMKNTVAEAEALRGLSTTWLDAGNPSRAEPLLRRSQKLLENNPEARPWALASVLTNLGRCYRMEDKLALSEDALTRAYDLQQKAFGPSHPQVAFVMQRLAEVYSLRRQFSLAREYSEKAMIIMKTACGENSAAYAAALLNRAAIEHRANNLGAAADNYAAALKVVRADPRVRADNVPLETQILEYYSMVLKATHRDREAKDLSAIAKSFKAK